MINPLFKKCRPKLLDSLTVNKKGDVQISLAGVCNSGSRIEKYGCKHDIKH
jgi:hypothetical protein